MGEQSLLSDRAILREIQEESIVIEPFVRANLGTASYDVTLGENYYRHWGSDLRRLPTIQGRDEHRPIFNPYDEDMVNLVWGQPRVAMTLESEDIRATAPLKGIAPTDKIIWVFPGETLLCHTQEFIGGRRPTITSSMSARSGIGRSCIEVCKCANKGDVGYVNRWTMEVTNNSQELAIPLVVGRRIAQIAFFKVEAILDHDYGQTGKYQTNSHLDEIKAAWEPSMMLPKLYKDREAIAANALRR